MPIIVDGEEYLTTAEAADYLGVTPLTLRNRARANNIKTYKQGITRNVYYRKSDLDSLKALRPNTSDEEEDDE